MPEFTPFPKIPRLKRTMVVTEKLDGTNAQILITEDGGFYVGSRKRWIRPEAIAGKGADNFGFAAWAYDNHDELLGLGPGQHFGEWWGKGIQRGYGLEEKRFSLFNVDRWTEEPCPSRARPGTEPAPGCCMVVPVVAEAEFSTRLVRIVMRELASRGSLAAPGYMNPEGVVVRHQQSGQLFKHTFEHDAEGKERTA